MNHTLKHRERHRYHGRVCEDDRDYLVDTDHVVSPTVSRSYRPITLNTAEILLELVRVMSDSNIEIRIGPGDPIEELESKAPRNQCVTLGHLAPEASDIVHKSC